MSNKYAGTPPSTREAARLAWRARVNAEARRYQRYAHIKHTVNGRTIRASRCLWFDPACWLFNALSAPRPWRSTRKPTPRRRYSRAERMEYRRRWIAGGRDVWVLGGGA